MFSLESPHRGDSNEYTQHTIFNIKKSPEIIPNAITRRLQLGTQERVRYSRGKQAISARSTEVLLYFTYFLQRRLRTSAQLSPSYDCMKFKSARSGRTSGVAAIEVQLA